MAPADYVIRKQELASEMDPPLAIGWPGPRDGKPRLVGHPPHQSKGDSMYYQYLLNLWQTVDPINIGTREAVRKLLETEYRRLNNA